MRQTTLTITPNFATKKCTLVGKIAVGESVLVTVNGADLVAADTSIRLRYNGQDVARFPSLEEDAWTEGTDLLTGTIDLNTVEFWAAFNGMDERSPILCDLYVESTSPNALSAHGTISVKNWVQTAGDGVPFSISTWRDDIADINAVIVALSAWQTNHPDDADAHKALLDLKAEQSEFSDHITGNNPHNITLAGLGAANAADFAQYRIFVKGKMLALKSGVSEVAAMPSTTDKERKTQFSSLLTKITEAIGAFE